MENASKALIIAAAILIAIVLITVGVYIIGVGQDQIKNSGMSDIDKTAFNQKFLGYEGAQKGSVVRTIVNEVMAINNSSEASDESRVGVTGTAGVVLEAQANQQPNWGNLRNTQTYYVRFGYLNGRINEIRINTNANDN